MLFWVGKMGMYIAHCIEYKTLAVNLKKQSRKRACMYLT